MTTTTTQDEALPSTLAIGAVDAKSLASAITTKEDYWNLAIDNEVSSRFAQGMIAGLKARIDQLDGERKELTRPLDDLKTKLIAKYRPAIQALTELSQRLSAGVIAFDQAQQAAAAAKQREADEAAAKEQRRLDALAAKAEARGDTEKAASFAERANAVVPAAIVSAAPRAPGTTIVAGFDFEITDPTKINIAYCKPDEQKIRKQISALGKDAAQLIGPGIRIFDRHTLRSSRKGG